MTPSLRMQARDDEEKRAMQQAAEDARQEVRDRREYTRCPDCGERVLRPSHSNFGGGYRDEKAPRLETRAVLLRPAYQKARRRAYLYRGEGEDAAEVEQAHDQALHLEHICKPQQP